MLETINYDSDNYHELDTQSCMIYYDTVIVRASTEMIKTYVDGQYGTILSNYWDLVPTPISSFPTLQVYFAHILYWPAMKFK